MTRSAIDAEPGAATSDAATSDFAEWVKPHLAIMTRLAAVRAPGADPDDVIQEALIRAWQKRATYDPERGSVRNWLLAVTADQARRIRRRRLHLDRTFALDDRTPTSDRAADMDLRRAVKAMPKRQREAVVLFYYVDLSIQETAALMGCSPGTVKSTLSDARSRLGRILEVNDD